MGIFSRSPRNIKKPKVVVAHPSGTHSTFASNKHHTTTVTHYSKEQARNSSKTKKFRAAVHAVIFCNNLIHIVRTNEPSRCVEKTTTTKKARNKLRASIRCRDLMKLLKDRLAIRRKFRSSIKVVQLVNSLAIGIAARRKFRASVNILMVSSRLVYRPLHHMTGVVNLTTTFQDSVNLITAVNRLERPFPSPPRTAAIHPDVDILLDEVSDARKVAVAHGKTSLKQQNIEPLSPTVPRGTLNFPIPAWQIAEQEGQQKTTPKAE